MTQFATITGDLRAFLDGELTEMARDVRAAVTLAAEGMRDELRDQVRAAGLGAGLEKAWRSEIYPKRRSRTLRPAGLVYSKATVLHQAYAEGPTIVAGKRFLVIALPEAIKRGFGYSADLPRGPRGIPGGAKRKYSQLGAAMASLGRANLRIVPAKRSGTFLVLYQASAKKKPVPLFILLRQTKVRRVLDIDGPAEKWLNAMYAHLSTMRTSI
jgi:hypothetical protein